MEHHIKVLATGTSFNTLTFADYTEGLHSVLPSWLPQAELQIVNSISRMNSYHPQPFKKNNTTESYFYSRTH
jgi:hypothetical protein